MLSEFVPPEVRGGKYFSNTNITLGEWYELGFYDPEDESWFWDYYDAEQYTRVCDKFLARYWYREAGVQPAARWKRTYLGLFNELMPKMKILYKWLEEGFDPRVAEDVFGKSRDIYSDFPATLLTSNEDYASTGNDNEYEKITWGNQTELWDLFVKNYKDPDALLLDAMEPLFTCLITSTVPMF